MLERPLLVLFRLVGTPGLPRPQPCKRDDLFETTSQRIGPNAELPAPSLWRPRPSFGLREHFVSYPQRGPSQLARWPLPPYANVRHLLVVQQMPSAHPCAHPPPQRPVGAPHMLPTRRTLMPIRQ